MGNRRTAILSLVIMVASSMACSAPKPPAVPHVASQPTFVTEGPLTIARRRPTNSTGYSKAVNGNGYGSRGTAGNDYRFPAAIDPLVMPDVETEIWARVVWPVPFEGAHPLVVMMHGQHPTCGRGSNPRIDDNDDYAATGVCPNGYRQAMSYLGFEYIASRLASHGFVVVSINANRGVAIDDKPGTADALRMAARAKLILRHIEKLARWNAGDEPTPSELGIDLRGTIDFDHMGLVGHSRGAEASRIAYNEYKKSAAWKNRIGVPLSIRGIFEIAGTDYEQSLASDVAWVSLMPVCDGDIPPGFQMRTYGRHQASAQDKGLKGTLAIWGANHNFFNSEWHVSEIAGCLAAHGGGQIFDWELGGSPEQQLVAGVSAVAFMRANVDIKPDNGFNDMFDPTKPLPASIAKITRIDRNEFPAFDGSEIGKAEDSVSWERGKGGKIGGLSGVFSEFAPFSLTKIRYVRVRANMMTGNFFFSVVRADQTKSPSLNAKDFRPGRIVVDEGNTYEAIDFPADRLNPEGSESPVVKVKLVFDNSNAGEMFLYDITLGAGPP